VPSYEPWPRQPLPRPQPPRPAPAPQNRPSRQVDDTKQKVVDQAVAFCADVLTSSWEEAVADRAAQCLKPRTWNKLFKGRRRGDCKIFARLARAVLDGKEKLHELVGTAGGWIAGKLAGEGFERKVAKELAERIPIPVVDQQASVVARALQMIGIAICLGNGIPLNRCQCFIDLSLTETKEQVKRICAAALEDWSEPSAELLAAWGRARISDARSTF
jgi:hypothetical protein